MSQTSIKKLTLSLVAFLVHTFLFVNKAAHAQEFSQQKMKSHLRWNLFMDKDEIQVSKKDNEVLIKSLNNSKLENLFKKITKFHKSNQYVGSVNYLPPEKDNNVSKIKVDLKGNGVELFSFYRDPEKKYVLDFWIDEKVLEEEKKVSLIRDGPEKKVEKKVPVIRPVKKEKPVEKKSTIALNEHPLYRDFRYGASMVWDYSALEPRLTKIINIERKTPEFFYPIKDRLFQKDDKEAHVQLAINLFKKKKYGLMYKSIKMYVKKYGDDANSEFLEYLKANALMRTSFETAGAEGKIAINMFKSLAENAKEYDMRSAIYRYLISFTIENQDHVTSLQLSKRFYVDSKENFDYEESTYAAEAILYNLSRLGQVDKVEKLISEKTIQKILPAQKLKAYQYFTHLSLGNTESVIKDFQENKSVMTKPIHAAILFNYAEASFRSASYEEAIKYFDEFLTNYSHMTKASDARLRIALAYDLSQKPYSEVASLYKTAIDKSSNLEKRYEAQVRYVAHQNLRKRKLTDDDREKRVFLEKPNALVISQDMQKLLWQTRLRLFLVDGQYKEALSYLTAIPLTSFKPIEKRVFEGDGAEAVFGLIMESYKNSDYSKIIKIWEVYSDRYIQKVAKDPYINYMVAKSYLKMSLLKGFDKVYKDFENLSASPFKSFPLWVERDNSESVINLALELQVIRDLELKNHKSAQRNVSRLRKGGSVKADFYQGVIAYQNREWQKSAKAFESYIARESNTRANDANELADLLHFYTDSLYNSKQTDRYLRVSKALLEDVEEVGKGNKYMDEVKERVLYLTLEIRSGMGDAASWLAAEGMITEFIKKYPKSIYRGRVHYLLGKTYVENKKVNEGMKVFNDLVNDDKVSDYIKELAKTELSYLKIKNRTI